ncbi:MAG: hypothetical protein V4503_02030 [Gemmatimonadota bacterium]
MRLPALSLLLVGSLLATPLMAQTATPASAASVTRPPAVTMPLGSYRVTMRDPNMLLPINEITMKLLADGSYEITMPKSAPILGTAKQHDGVLSWSGARCKEPGEFYVLADGDGYVLDLKADSCEDRRDQMVRLKFTPVKP